MNKIYRIISRSTPGHRTGNRTIGSGGFNMSSKTKIIVLHMKEVIYTGIFLLLLVIFGVVMLLMFGRHPQIPFQNTHPGFTGPLFD